MVFNADCNNSEARECRTALQLLVAGVWDTISASALGSHVMIASTALRIDRRRLRHPHTG
jgi:hypothetical protein